MPVTTSTAPTKLEETVAAVRKRAGERSRMVFVSGNFNVVHPGHVRLLNFARECGDFLVVGINDDDTPGAMLPGGLRLEGVTAISVVDAAVLLSVAPEEFVRALRPDVVVKGKEHERQSNPEQSVVDDYGGQLLFGSGEMRFSSIDLLQRELRESTLTSIVHPIDYLNRHEIDRAALERTVLGFGSMNVVVVGDLIVDEYIACDPLGMSQEDPTIVVTPISRDLFVGGAGIVAAHARGLGAGVSYFGVAGNDPPAQFALDRLSGLGVRARLIRDESRPTTLKQRFRARGKTLLRVSHLRQHDISHELMDRMLTELRPVIEQADLLVFSDFNYGNLPQPLVDEVALCCNRAGVPMVADSQSSSQIGDVSRFRGMLLVTPTEREARLALRDSVSGLTVLADALHRNAAACHVFITLGEEGLLVHSPHGGRAGLPTDQLPALNRAPRDVSGAGDSLLIGASLALVAGASIWSSAYLGSIAAACQVGRVGNSPLSVNEILMELRQ